MQNLRRLYKRLLEKERSAVPGIFRPTPHRPAGIVLLSVTATFFAKLFVA
jgi:hypothetical protein